MYNVNVLNECQDEEEMAVVISAVLAMLDDERHIDTDLIVRKLKRTNINAPSWNAVSREEY